MKDFEGQKRLGLELGFLSVGGLAFVALSFLQEDKG
jgi:hypothetical protein